MVCKKGMKSEDGEESSSTHRSKPPPLLEEELTELDKALNAVRAAPLLIN